MPRIKPFKAVRYNTAKVKDISSVVAPPYDVISQKLQGELYRKDEHNFVKIELNRIKASDDDSSNRYIRSRDLFASWLKDRIMISDDKDALYIYALKYKRGTKAIEQVGFIGLMGLEPDGGNILPHENTLAAPKEDRLKLTRAVKANLSPIFVLYEDKAHGLTQILKKFMSGNKPLIDMESDGVRHRLWNLEEKNSIKKIVDSMAHKDIFIADGHHRYEVSRMYSREAGTDSSKYMMVYFVEMDERMLTVLPAHRILKDIGDLNEEEISKKLERFFYVEKAPALKALLARMSALSKEHAFGMYLGKDDYRLLRLKSVKDSDKAIKDKPAAWKRLDVSILHHFIIQRVLGVRDDDDNIEFLKSAQDSVDAVDSDEFKLAFFLNPTKVSEVKRIAGIGERMPRKATYFYPKPLSGLVINKF
ncbi:MAG: DUF1015 domain-containing protein [Candidatus Omnitrophica bacterium]|nr:DUF1015 domain-containing protein [Candidatus Omnitrophota bacterium]